MGEQKNDAGNTISVSIGRQPIFNEKRRVWGYALFCLGQAGPLLSVPSQSDGVAVCVASSAYVGLQQIVDRGNKVLVGFSEKSILNYLPYALPPEMTVVQVTPEIFEKPSVPGALAQLKSDGYALAVLGFNSGQGFQPLYAMADIVALDVRNLAKPLLEKAVGQARVYKSDLLAMHVADGGQFLLCQDLGVTLFHGTFFKRPDTVEVRQLNSNEMARFNLLGMLEQADPDFDKLAESIQADVSLSFRLLAYLNSAAFGLRQKISSIHQAISLLGWRKMKNWLRVVLLNDMGQKTQTPELMAVAVQRGKFLELVARDHDFWGFDPEMLHLLGIFSLLDAMLGMPMTEIVNYLPLDGKLKAALCREPNNEYLPLLELTGMFEEGRWEQGRQMTGALNLDLTKVQAAFQAAVDWGNEVASLNTAQPNDP